MDHEAEASRLLRLLRDGVAAGRVDASLAAEVGTGLTAILNTMLASLEEAASLVTDQGMLIRQLNARLTNRAQLQQAAATPPN